MLLFLIAAVLSPLAVAQNTTFDPNSVDQTTKNQWCQSEIDTCLLLCNGDGENACESGTLQYTCICSNNSPPANIAQYQGTIPNYICQRAYSQCTTGSDGLSSSERCQTCGTLQASDVPDSASRTSAAPSTSRTSAAPSTLATQLTTSPAAAKSSSAPTGLSSSAKIGVGVGVSLGAVSCAIISVGLLLLRRRRNRLARLEDAGDGGSAGKRGATNKPVMQELDGDANGPSIGSGVRELDAIESPRHTKELTGSPGPQRYELE